MARLLFNNEWFEEIASRGHYESEFEGVLQQEAHHLFTSYHFVPFKTTVYSEVDADSRQPDFALIHRSYRSWWVVEVELVHHSLHGHVLPQVRTLARAKYGLTEASYLCDHHPDLDRDKVIEMFRGSPPRVLVVVNGPVDGWAEHLNRWGVKVAICQIFRSRLNKYVLRLNGEYPSENDEVITTCECSSVIHRYLVIHSPTQLPIQRDERVLLYYQGQAAEWRRTDISNQVFLHALRDHDLEQGKQYEIIRQSDERFVIRLAKPLEDLKRRKK
ncbi:MAG: hypothetical protein OXI72_07465 [Gemmatimonadota bacterium]|nr:hypothetical protein [Gemmatimonadota bacterium]